MGARRPRLALLCGMLLALAVAPGAQAQKPTPADPALEQAKEESGVNWAPVARLRTPIGRVRVLEPELLAATFGQKIHVELELDRDVADASVRIGIPQAWRTRPGGRATTLAPRLSKKPERAALRRDDGAATIRLDRAREGATVQLEFEDRGIPAGTHRLPVTFTGADGRARSVGHVEVRLYAPVREAQEAESPWGDLRAINVTNDASEESETFITAVPGDPQRVLAGVNGGGGYNAWLTTNGGGSWTKLAVPAAADIPGGSDPSLDLCCDPMSAADAAGNIWYGGLSLNPGSRITVSRIAAGTSAFVNTVGLPRRTTGTQDKPMMTIDNSPSSPTFGRLYVVWNEPTNSGGLNIAMSKCETRPGGVATPANCDEADNWSTPVSITKSTGSYIYADVAVGPNGRAYVVWWDFSSANAIRGATCEPGADCTTVAAWTSASTVATLDATGGAPLPFACPILAQPGGRASTSPQVETDISGTASDGRVYVTWSDLRTGSGSTRCEDGLPPAATHLTFDSFVASASNALPGGAGASPVVGTRLLTDGEGGGQANSDDWFAWLAVDQTTGQAYADLYSTRHDATRETTHFYARSVGVSGALGQLVQVSTAPSDYSGAQCCNFGNDYGDYTGIDATSGSVFPIWSDKSTADGEALIDVASPPAPGPAATLDAGALVVSDPAPAGDADGIAEPGETLTVSIPITNQGSASATSTTATLTSPSGLVTFPDGVAGYGTIGIGQTANPDAPYRVKLAKTLGCGTEIPLALGMTYTGGANSEQYALATGTSVVQSATGLPVAIPDNSATGAASTINAAGPGTISDLDVGVSLTHSWIGDITLRLRGPDATQITLTARPGGTSNSGDNLSGTIFDDEAPTALGAGAAPYTGRFRPDQALSTFDGRTMAGTWTLTAVDGAASDTGSITAWSLRRSVCAVAPTAAISGPTAAATGQSVQFDASGSSDLDGSIAKYEWDLDGDGSFETSTGAVSTAQTSFATDGARTVSVRVTDNGSLADEAAAAITVTAGAATEPPVVDPTPTPTVTPTPEGPFARLAGRSTVKVKKGRFPVTIVGCKACRGTVDLKTARKVRGKRVRVARFSYRLDASGKATVRVRLTKAGRKLLRRSRKVSLRAAITAVAPTGASAKSSGKLAIRR